MKRRNDSQREARDLTSQDIQACCRRNARCSELKTLCDSQNHQLIASIHILKCAKKNCIGLPTRWGDKKKSCPTVCCITWLHFLLRRRVSLFGTSEDRVRSTPTVFVCLALPWGQVSLWGGELQVCLGQESYFWLKRGLAVMSRVLPHPPGSGQV